MELGTFQTQSGYCHVLEESIVFNSHKDSFQPENNKKAIFRNKVVDGIIILFLISLIIYNISKADYTAFLIFATMFMTYYAWPFVKKKKTSRTSIISRANVQTIEYKIRKLGKKTGYFEITFIDEQGEKARDIDMPSFEKNGTVEIEKAKALFKNYPLNT